MKDFYNETIDVVAGEDIKADSLVYLKDGKAFTCVPKRLNWKVIAGMLMVTLVLAILAVLAVKLVIYSVDKSHKIYCSNLHKQAEQYALWYATEAEREMCKSLDIELPPDNTAYPDGQPWPHYKSNLK